MNWSLLYKKSTQNLKPLDIQKILLENRGVKTKEDVEDFLHPRVENVSFKNTGIATQEVKKAIALVKKNIDRKKAIIIYGDYDVDGVTGTAILWETLFQKYKDVHPYIPHRIDEGYGLSESGVRNLNLKIKNCGLIITVDNGIVAHKAVEYAKSLGISVIITDHHTKGKNIPDADAVIHTTQLCGASVAYLLSQEIRDSQFGIRNKIDTRHAIDTHLELAALATVADLVPLNRYNRSILKHGLTKLHTSKRAGLLALFNEAKVSQKEIDTYQIGHIIAPRLNAAGRISHALDSLRLICTTDTNRAKELAITLGQINMSRQNMTFESAENAAEEIRKKKKLENLTFVESKMYEQGVIGLIASRLVEEFYRPAVAVSKGAEISKGSARSITGINIIELIRSCSSFLTEAGGHPMAAGFSLKTKDLPAFKKAMLKKAEEFPKKMFEKELKIDLEIEFEHITLNLFEEIQKLKPFGMGNPTPIFMTKAVSVIRLNRVGKEGSHLQMLLEKDGYLFKGILFNHGEKEDINIGDIINIAYTIELNEWKDKKSLELKIKDFTFQKLI